MREDGVGRWGWGCVGEGGGGRRSGRWEGSYYSLVCFSAGTADAGTRARTRCTCTSVAVALCTARDVAYEGLI